MIINTLLKKIVETFIIKARKKKERTITLILPLNLPFNLIKFKSVKVYIIIIKNSKKTDLTDLIKNEN